MKVAVDASSLRVTRAGVARYVRGILRGLRESARDGDEVSPIEFQFDNFDFRQPRRSLITAFREGVWGPLLAPLEVRARGSQVLHSPHPPIIQATGLPQVTTLHDLAVIERADRFRKWHRWSGRRRLEQLKRQRTVIAISEFTAGKAVALLGLDRRRLRVIHSGCDYVGTDVPAGTRPAALADNEDFFLFVGSLEPGKNLQLLVETWDLARKAGLDLPPLVVAGARWQGVGRESAPPGGWKYLGHIPETELIYLYRHARAFLFPSTYEGWGLPVHEAMALDCPVVACPLTAVPEAAGEAALLVEPRPEVWLDAIRSLLDDGARQCWIEQGRRRVRDFTWKATGEALWDTYRQAA